MPVVQHSGNRFCNIMATPDTIAFCLNVYLIAIFVAIVFELLFRGSDQRVGRAAPDFTLEDQDGKKVNLNALLKDPSTKFVVLYFYPKDFTIGCTAQACSFRDNYADFQKAGAVVLGVSRDRTGKHQMFKEHHSLPFPLLSDPEGKVSDLYDVGHWLLGLLPGRVTFIIDKSGTIVHTYVGMLNAKKHVAEALRAVNVK